MITWCACFFGRLAGDEVKTVVKPGYPSHLEPVGPVDKASVFAAVGTIVTAGATGVIGINVLMGLIGSVICCLQRQMPQWRSE